MQVVGAIALGNTAHPDKATMHSVIKLDDGSNVVMDSSNKLEQNPDGTYTVTSNLTQEELKRLYSCEVGNKFQAVG